MSMKRKGIILLLVGAVILVGCVLINRYVSCIKLSEKWISSVNTGEYYTMQVDDNTYEPNAILSEIGRQTVIVPHISPFSKMIDFEITAPDLHDVFSYINPTKMTSAEIIESEFIQYIQGTDKRVTNHIKVNVSGYPFHYLIDANQWQTDECVNALTGGFLDAFDNFLEEYYNELLEE